MKNGKIKRKKNELKKNEQSIIKRPTINNTKTELMSPKN